METIKSGLSFYAYFKTYGMIFLGVIMFILTLAMLYKTITGNYQKSPSSEIDYYNITNLNKCSDTEIVNNLCKLQLVYSDGITTYKNDIDAKSKVGETTVFYEQKNPKSYMVTPSPYAFPGMLSFVTCFILAFAMIRLMIMKSSKDGAAMLGTFDAVRDVSRYAFSDD